MMTKAEERKVLAKIKALIESAGEDSYIGYAFEGCIEMAESNIENDFANSPRKCIDNLHNRLAERTSEWSKLGDQLAKAEKELETLKAEQKKHTLPRGLYEVISCNVGLQLEEADRAMQEASETLVKLRRAHVETCDIVFTETLDALGRAMDKRKAALNIIKGLEGVEAR